LSAQGAADRESNRYDVGMEERSSCPDCQAAAERATQAEERLTKAEAVIADLTRRLEATERAGKRQAAPFRKGPPKADPKTPGRKAGCQHGPHGHRPPPSPEQVTECLEAPLPDDCPHCRGALVETEVAQQFQTEIPRQPIVRQFNVHIGHCERCGKRVQGRHALQTSDALGAAAAQIGPDAQATVVLLNKEAGLSHGKVAEVFDQVFGIDLSRGASAQINLRAAERLESDYELILEEVKKSEVIVPDESGWRIGGYSAWLHAWVGDRATAYAIDSQRSAAVLSRVIGEDWDGTMIHDGFASYNAQFVEAIHQQCLAHVLRRAHTLEEAAVGGGVRFPRQVIALLTEAIHERKRCVNGEIALARLTNRRDEFDERLWELLWRPRSVPEQETFAAHLRRHAGEIFAFVTDPFLEATNWQAEQAIRPAVVNRKVWGGNRTAAGARAQSVLMSVLETCRRHARSALDYISQTLRSAGNLLLPRPVLLPTR
jgi:transposase